MEATISGSQQDVLVGPLSLGLDPGASYITQKREATVHSAVPSCSFNGVNTLRLQISSATEWMDVSSMYVAFNIVNESAAPLQFCGQPHVIFNRLQIRAGGAELEDIAMYNRLCEQFHIMQSTATRLNAAQYGLPTKIARENADATLNPNLFMSQKHMPQEVPANSTRKVCMTFPLSSIFGASQQKYLPLFAMNGGIELLLSLSDPASHLITTGGKGTSYRLENIQLHTNLITLDTALQEKYFQSLARGDAMLIHTKCWSHHELFLSPSQGSFECSVNKPFSRLATVFASYTTELSGDDIAGGKNYVNNFEFFTNQQQAIEVQLQVGSMRIPEFPAQGVAELWMRLQAALGVQNSLAHSLGVSFEDYVTQSHMAAFDLEKLPLAASTGTSTQGGQEVRLAVKNLQSAQNVQMKRCYLALHADCIFEVRAGGITKLD